MIKFSTLDRLTWNFSQVEPPSLDERMPLSLKLTSHWSPPTGPTASIFMSELLAVHRLEVNWFPMPLR
jgi:hypothetical protein